jgi:NAD+ synthase
MTDIVRAEHPIEVTFSEAELNDQKEHITSFISQQFDRFGANVAVIGLSGGIDSTLTSYLTVNALGADSVYGLVMPSSGSVDKNMSDAERIADEELGIEFDIIEIEPLVDSFFNANPNIGSFQPKGDDDVPRGLGALQARIRAVLLNLVADRRVGFVVGTRNRSEAAVGHTIKHGDGAVHCQPIENLYKQQVRQLGEHIGISEDLTDKMWDTKIDEEALGIGYNTLDSIIALHIDGSVPAGPTAELIGVDENVVKEVRRMHKGSLHKRHPPQGPSPLY